MNVRYFKKMILFTSSLKTFLIFLFHKDNLIYENSNNLQSHSTKMQFYYRTLSEHPDTAVTYTL